MSWECIIKFSFLIHYGFFVYIIQEAMKLQQDMRKKRQEMLEKQIECQKVLKESLVGMLECCIELIYKVVIVRPTFAKHRLSFS